MAILSSTLNEVHQTFSSRRILLLHLKMRLLGILVWAVCFLVLVSAKIDTDVTLNDLLKEESNINGKTDSADVEGPKKVDDPRKSVRRFFPRYPRPVTLPIAIPSYANSFFFRASYCFTRRCFGELLKVVLPLFYC